VDFKDASVALVGLQQSSLLQVMKKKGYYKVGQKMSNHYEVCTLASQTFNISSKLPEQSRRASGLNDIEYTASVWFLRTCKQVPLNASHILIVASKDPVANIRGEASGPLLST
jgi:hypothetical protein